MLNETQRRAVRNTYRRLRDDRNLQAQDVAGKAGIHFTAYSAIENGRRLPTPAQFKAIARALKVAVTALPGSDSGKQAA